MLCAAAPRTTLRWARKIFLREASYFCARVQVCTLGAVRAPGANMCIHVRNPGQLPANKIIKRNTLVQIKRNTLVHLIKTARN